MPPITIEDGCLVLPVPFSAHSIGLPLWFVAIVLGVVIALIVVVALALFSKRKEISG